LTPERVWVPLDSVTPPVPPMTPANVPFALESVRFRSPSVTLPLPARLASVAPLRVPLMSRLPLAMTALDAAMLASPLSASEPSLMVVVPVYVLSPVSVSVPSPILVSDPAPLIVPAYTADTALLALPLP
jgi:hypothetical protein